MPRFSKLSPLLLLVAFASLIAQDPVLRVRTYTVVVDVVVTDGKNRQVHDLKADDFIVLEEGVRQEIESFRSVHADAPAQPSPAPSGDVKDVSPDEQQNRIEPTSPARPNLIILLLDYATTEYLNQNYVRDAAVEYVETRMRPGDLMAIFQVGMSLRFLRGFTNDKQALIETLNRMDSAGSHYALDQAGLAGQAETAQSRVELLSSGIEAAGQAAQAGANVAALIQILDSQLEQAQALEGLYYSQLSYSHEQQSRPVIGAIRTIADGVSQIPGRKTLMLFSQGFSVPLTVERALYNAVERAARSNLTIYAVDAGGLTYRNRSTESELHDISAARQGDRVRAYGGLSQFDRAREIGSDQKDSTLRYLTKATGGFLVRNTNNLFDALERIDEDVRGHYLLTYQPKNLKFDGEFRAIEVNVKQRGLKVRARSGYWAVPPGASLLSADEYRSLTAFPKKEKRKAEPLSVYAQPAYFLDVTGQYDVVLTMEVPLAELTPQQDEQSVAASYVHLQLVGLVEDESGTVVTSFRGPSRIRLSNQELEANQDLRLDSRLQLQPGRYSVLLRVTDPVSGRTTRQQRSLLLPPFSDTTSLSSLVLSGALAPAPPEGAETGLFEVDQVQILPSARRSFRNGDQMVYLLNVYHPGLEPVSGTADCSLEVTISRRGRVVSQSQEEFRQAQPLQDPLPHLRLARFLELEGLQPGRYLLRAQLTDRVSLQTVTTQASFVVEE